MKDIQTKTFAVGLAALAAVGFSACSSNKSDSAQQTSASPATSTAAPAMTECAMAGSRVRPDRLGLRGLRGAASRPVRLR